MQIVGCAGVGVVEQAGDEVFRQQADVLREQSDEHLEDETLGDGAFDAAFDELVEALRQTGGGVAGDSDVVVVEDGLGLAGEEEGERAEVFGQIDQRDLADGRVHLRLEVVNVELVEVAQDDVARASGDEAGPVVERLTVVLGEVDAALLHLDEDDGLPDVIGEAGTAAIIV